MIDRSEELKEQAQSFLTQMKVMGQVKKLFGSFGGHSRVRYYRTAGQLKMERPREEQFRRFGAAERKRERRQARNLAMKDKGVIQ